MLQILVVLGTRPEAIKLAPVVAELRRRGIIAVVCVSGQHGDLADRALSCVEIEPGYRFEPLRLSDLALMTEAITARVANVLVAIRADWVVVQGDTTTAFAAALAASQAGVPVAHVEAGLRTGDLAAPYPEEGHRRAIASLAARHFAPTANAASNLISEGVDASAITLTGNTAVDALLAICERLDTDSDFARTAQQEIASVPADRRIILLTGHRRESHGAALEDVAAAITAIARRGDVSIVHLAHPNPGLRSFHAALANIPGICSLPPLSHPACVSLMRRAFAIVTDSGGIQEEAPSLGVPLLVTRRSTERHEVLECGAGRLVGTSARAIEEALGALLDDQDCYRAMAQVRSPFGDGKAAPRIVDRLLGACDEQPVTKGQTACAI